MGLVPCEETDAQVFATLEARDPTLAATVHDIRHYAAEDIRFGMRYTDALTDGRGRHAGFGPDQNRRTGARCRRPSGTGLDGAGRRTGIGAVARAGTGPGGFVLKRCDRPSQDVEIRRRSGFDMPVDGSFGSMVRGTCHAR